MEWCIFGILATITDSALLLIQTIENMQLLLLKKKKKKLITALLYNLGNCSYI